MPCVEENPKEVDVALQILDIVTPRINVSADTDSEVVRETSQTDHLNKRLLQTFLQRLNVMSVVPTDNTEPEEDNSQEFED
ncbi:hypothetical protein FF38_09842 [Lucilia cuprina]|uniref:Uncharacterized protein n=1 Tax=Lucilia cuprina TaxID=7375 RepID=A0A0L0CMJ4_LUCCU|nr:hypothetical protein CVS40_2036 [Lucilia cuprina]KNC33432.1 hypothetical protein FF38_09842 [Lucilia cuprina]